MKKLEELEKQIQELNEKVQKNLQFPDSKLVSELTVNELKNIIRNIVREELSNRDKTTGIPVQPFYYQPIQPWQPAHEVWYDTKTTPAKPEIGEING